MCADIFTKFFAGKTKGEWARVHQNVGIYASDPVADAGKPYFTGAWIK